MRRVWAWYLGVGLAVGAVELVLPFGLSRDLLFVLVGTSAVVAVGVGVHLHRPRRVLPWVLLATGAAAWVAGDLLWLWFTHLALIEPSPSLADAFYLAAYPLLAGSLYQLARGRSPQGDWSSVLDAVIVAVVVALVLWVLFVQPGWTTPTDPFDLRLVTAAYPVGGALLLVQLVFLRASPVGRSAALRLLTAAVAAALITDLAFQATAYLPWLAEQELLLDAGWMAAYLLWGAAALHPSMTRVSDGRATPTAAFTTGRVLLLGAAFLVLPVLSAVELWVGISTHTLEVAIAHGVLVVLVVLRMLDVVVRMRVQSAHLAHLADCDFLTGLANRRRFAECVAGVVETSHPDGTARHAVLLAGLDRFTEINDTLGHRVGDELLRTAAGVVRTAAGAEAVCVARIGGDVFGVLVSPLLADPADLAARMQARLGAPLTVAGLGVTVGATVGFAVAPQDGTDADDLLSRADLALSAARARIEGVGRYDPQVQDGGGLAAVLMTELQGALVRGDVVVHFQPQVELATGRVLGAEALVRWQHPERGLIPPDQFVPAAERTGLIRMLTLVVLDRAVAQCAIWAAEGREMSVAVNLSVRNLLDPRLVDDVCEILERYAVPAARLELEITETVAMVDPIRAGAVLGELSRLGVTVSIDDYGTGYGSLAYLQRLPVSRLKIDRSFVAGILTDPASAAIVRSTIDLARQLGLSVIAEGVEDDRTLLALHDMDCFAAQGFGLGRPVPAPEVWHLLDRIEVRLPPLLTHPGAVVPSPRLG